MPRFNLSRSVKNLLLILVVLFVFRPWYSTAQKAVVDVLTYNIRLATPDDAPNTWDNRRENVFSVIRSVAPDVFGLQEVLSSQLADLEAAFPGYTRIGVGRDDGKAAGEFSPLFFNTKRFSMLSSGTFWLSQTPSVAGSRGWDAACNRVVSWVQLKDKKSSAVFLVFCTHFDHMGETARRNSSKLLLHAVDSLAGFKPVIVLGDFNAETDSEPTAYSLIFGSASPGGCKADLPDGYRSLITPLPGLKLEASPAYGSIIYLSKIMCRHFPIKLAETHSGEYYPSDHLPVSASLRLY
ncbi:MAG: endonuclease/exonuclease/phosphatase family protein [Bacteroidales bacterium]